MSAFPSCDAKNCGLSTSVPGLRVFPFPKWSNIAEDRAILLIWKRVAQLADDETGRWLCERHFKRMEFSSRGGGLVKQAVPTYPTGPLNPLTQNYCPRGREHLDRGFRSAKIQKTVNKIIVDDESGVEELPVPRKTVTVKLMCLIVWCPSNEDTKGVTLFSLPLNDPELMKKWVEAIPIKHWQPGERHRLCSAHFSQDSMILSDDGRHVLRENAIPSVFKQTNSFKCPEKMVVDLTAVNFFEPQSSTDQIPLLSVNGELFARKTDIKSKLNEKIELTAELSKTILNVKEAMTEKNLNSVVRFLNKKDKADPSTFLDLFVAKKCPVECLEAALFLKKSKRPRLETKSQVVELASGLEVTIPKQLPILERFPSQSPKIPASTRDLTKMPLDELVDELNMRKNQIDLMFSGLFEMMEKWFSEKGIQNAYNEYCWEGIKAALQRERGPEKRDRIIDSSRILMFFAPEIYHALSKTLPPLTDVLCGKSNLGSTPGFTVRSFKALTKHSDRSPVCLSFLEQAVETEVLWDGSKLRGYCDYGFDAPFTDSTPKASRVLVFFATCLKTDFRIPLGYHFVDHVPARVIANITKCYLTKLFQSKVQCCAIVCEPESKNLEALKCLGFDYNFIRSSSVDSTWIYHPDDKSQKIYGFFDSFRLVQQAGYLLVERGELKVFGFSQPASWSHISDLEGVIDETISKDGKITSNSKKNSEWVKIVEKLDTQQTFFLNKCRSEALDFCSRNSLLKVPTCRSTIAYIDKINEFYDCCSSTKTQDCRPLTKETKDEFNAKIKDLTTFFWNMWVSNDFEKGQGRKMPIPGILLNLSNLAWLIREYEHFFKDGTVEIFTSRVNMTRFDEFLSKMKVDGQNASPFGFQKNYENELRSFHSFKPPDLFVAVEVTGVQVLLGREWVESSSKASSRFLCSEMLTEVLNVCKNCHRRQFSVKASKKNKTNYKDSLLLPKTDFPQWVGSSRRVLHDEEILQRCGFPNLYSVQRSREAEEFVLHDGPPYANGVPHMGHAVNKVLKDIVSRWQLLSGKKIHFKPGWDCHGLPIELKAIAGRGRNLSPLDVRQKAKCFADEAIKNQKAVFKTWGLMADWDSPEGCYRTFDPAYITNQLEQFYSLYIQGLIFRDLKPVYWSPSSKTALAEAELEYNPEHVSTAVTVKLTISKLPGALEASTPVHALVWTTTPWTLPMNEAVAYNPQLNYSIVKSGSNFFLVASDTMDNLKSKLKLDVEVFGTFSGTMLKGALYDHPLTKETKPFLEGSHVTSDMGTGLVHIAPAHGPDDYLIGLNNNLPLKCLVDETGRYTEELGFGLPGLSVLREGQSKVLEILRNDTVHQESITHSYPYDWRSKGPVIVRASHQWFLDTNSVKQKALEVLGNITVYPNRNTGGLVAQLQRRPYWCISRQRSWGVPIPSLYLDGKPIIERDLIDNYKKLVKESGIDFWWKLPVKDLVPDSLKRKFDVSSLSKGQDIMDIWLDSGLSWAVLDGKTADLCVEGIDQFTGWFQASLLTSIALKKRAPYKSLLVHGFVVDDNGRKMSKSLGNVVDPVDIVKGGPDQKKTPPFGVDVLRWWVGAHATQHTNIPVSQRVLKESSEDVSKLRNSLKFLLGCIRDFPEENLKFDPLELSVIDEYILYGLDDLHTSTCALYESYEFNKVCINVLNFISNKLSSFYNHLSKDRLYCHEAGSLERRNIQFVMYHTLSTLMKILGPILPVLIEEVRLHHPHNSEKTPYFYDPLPVFDVKTLRRSKETVERITSRVFDLRGIILKECPRNLTSSQLSCDISADGTVLADLKVLQLHEDSCTSDLVNALKVSSIVLKPTTQNSEGMVVQVRVTDYHHCERCRRYSALIANELCFMCSTALKS